MTRTLCFIMAAGFAMPCFAEQLETKITATVDNAAYYELLDIKTAYENTWHQEGDF